MSGARERERMRREILREHTAADLNPGETLKIEAESTDPNWYRAVVINAHGERCAVAFWHRPTSTLCDRLSV